MRNRDKERILTNSNRDNERRQTRTETRTVGGRLGIVLMYS